MKKTALDALACNPPQSPSVNGAFTPKCAVDPHVGSSFRLLPSSAVVTPSQLRDERVPTSEVSERVSNLLVKETVVEDSRGDDEASPSPTPVKSKVTVVRPDLSLLVLTLDRMLTSVRLVATDGRHGCEGQGQGQGQSQRSHLLAGLDWRHRRPHSRGRRRERHTSRVATHPYHKFSRPLQTSRSRQSTPARLRALAHSLGPSISWSRGASCSSRRANHR